MNDLEKPTHPSSQILAVSRVRDRILSESPEYGRHLTDADWERITERLEALARLLWRISCRRAAQARSAPSRPNDWS